LALHGFLVD
jgi:hypothetical protein